MILVTGISGALGRLVFDRLSEADGSEGSNPAGPVGMPGVVGGTRSGDGVATRRIDFDAPDTLREGFRGVDVLVVVSAGYAEDDIVLARHGAVVDAAAEAGVRHVIYTSLAGSGDRLTIALPHRWT
ncbi:NmrA family NAD(P)-binding protein, partial [Actinomadura adrarensis]